MLGGGIVYEYFDLPKLSPTVGCWFFAQDYIKFVSNLKHYLSYPIEISDITESKYYKRLVEMNNVTGLIGRLDDIEVIMLHYHNREEALAKWNRRVKRINYDNLIIKFSYMNDCTDTELSAFDDLDVSDISSHFKKIMFVSKSTDLKYKCAVLYEGYEDGSQIVNDTFYFKKYFDLYSFINDGTLKH